MQAQVALLQSLSGEERSLCFPVDGVELEHAILVKQMSAVCCQIGHQLYRSTGSLCCTGL